MFEAIKGRRSVRSYKPDPVEAHKIDALKDAIVWAPSAGNLQSRHFYFVYNKKVRKKLVAAALGQGFVAEAPLVIIGCADTRISHRYGERGASLYSVQDVACSVENLMLAAHSLGLATVWVGAFREERVSEIMGLPEYMRPVAIVPVGYPAESPEKPGRHPKDKAITDIE